MQKGFCPVLILGCFARLIVYTLRIRYVRLRKAHAGGLDLHTARGRRSEDLLGYVRAAYCRRQVVEDGEHFK